jgi:hypothetical protein
MILLGLIGLSLLVRFRERSPAAEPTPMPQTALELRSIEAEAFARELFRAYAGREPNDRSELERAELLVPRPPLTDPTPTAVAAPLPASD